MVKDKHDKAGESEMSGDNLPEANPDDYNIVLDDAVESEEVEPTATGTGITAYRYPNNPVSPEERIKVELDKRSDTVRNHYERLEKIMKQAHSVRITNENLLNIAKFLDHTDRNVDEKFSSDLYRSLEDVLALKDTFFQDENAFPITNSLCHTYRSIPRGSLPRWIKNMRVKYIVNGTFVNKIKDPDVSEDIASFNKMEADRRGEVIVEAKKKYEKDKGRKGALSAAMWVMSGIVAAGGAGTLYFADKASDLENKVSVVTSAHEALKEDIKENYVSKDLKGYWISKLKEVGNDPEKAAEVLNEFYGRSGGIAYQGNSYDVAFGKTLDGLIPDNKKLRDQMHTLLNDNFKKKVRGEYVFMPGKSQVRQGGKKVPR